jgi:Radical SAM superfamily/B12 binding domain
MILLVNPRATRPANRRFPLSVMAVGAALPPHLSWEIVDGNRPDVDCLTTISAWIRARAGGPDPVLCVALSVMPGPQLVSAVHLSRALKSLHPDVPLVWGGNFPSLYPRATLAAPYVDWVVRGQGERTMVELLDVLAGARDPREVAGLCYRSGDDLHVGRERIWVGPDDLPPPPYHRIPVAEYLHPTFLGRRNAVYQASIGCPYGCRFCGVISVFGSREKQEAPERTAKHIRWLVENHGVDAVHFYDNNFFVREDRALELAERLRPLEISWWCEARVDAMLRFSDRTWTLLRKAGLRMVFFGAESGSDDVLRKMDKKLTTAQTLDVAARTRAHDIIPEFSFVFGDPDEPAREIDNTLAFIRRLKAVNPAMELIHYYYTPTPQRRETYGNVDPLSGTPETLEGWIRPEWVRWMTHEDPRVPWMTPELRKRVEDFVLVLQSRFPSLHDKRTRAWGRAVGRVLARRPWDTGRYHRSRLLSTVRRWAGTEPDDLQAYGHLRPARSR